MFLYDFDTELYSIFRHAKNTLYQVTIDDLKFHLNNCKNGRKRFISFIILNIIKCYKHAISSNGFLFGTTRKKKPPN